MRNRLRLALMVFLAETPAMAQDKPGDAAAGRGLAGELCSSCHLVSTDQRGPVPDSVPTFMAIAAQPDMTLDRIVEVLISPSHPAMPPPPLDRQQMRDVAAYMLSLRRR